MSHFNTKMHNKFDFWRLSDRRSFVFQMELDTIR